MLASRASWWALLGHGHLLRHPAVRAACRAAAEVTLPMLDLERALTRDGELRTRLRFSRRTYAVGDETFCLPRASVRARVRVKDARRVAANLRLAAAFGVVAGAPEANGAPKVPVVQQREGVLVIVTAAAVSEDTVVVSRDATPPSGEAGAVARAGARA